MFLRYYALSAICALLKYAEYKLNQRYAATSLRIRYMSVEGTMMIDVASARNLELVTNVMSKRSSHSLFGYEAVFCRLL
jgi:DNA mismatch repair protein MSH4